MGKIVKVAFSIPTEGHTPPESLQSIRMMSYHHGKLEVESRGKDVEFQFYDRSVGRMFTPMAREVAARDALAAGMDYLFMVDDDMVCPFNLFEQLYRHQVDIVAPLAFTRNAPYLAVLYKITEGWDPIRRQNYVINEWIKNWPKDKLVECDAVGFGAVLIDLKVLKKIQQPYFMCSSGTGEDIWFCHQAKRQAGARIFMDTTTEIGHIGSPAIIGYSTYREQNKPEDIEKLYGPYKYFGVYDVCHLKEASEADKKEPEVLAW